MGRSLGVVGVAAAAGFLLIAAHVVSGRADAVDHAVSEWFHTATTPAWRIAFERFTWFGNGEVLTAATAVVMAVLAIRRQWLPALLWWAVQGLGATVTHLLKLSVGRARPQFADPALIEAGNLSFPSGHTMMTLVFVGYGLYFFLRRPRPAIERASAVIAACLWCLLMGASRLFLGNHFLSDVLGGYLLGVAWLAVAIAVTEAALRTVRRETRVST